MTCSLANDPLLFGDYWNEGEPVKGGYYLIRVGTPPDGYNPWVYLSQVYVGFPRSGVVLYGDGTGADYRALAFKGQAIMAWAEPTGANFEAALREIRDYHNRQIVARSGSVWELWRCSTCGERSLIVSGNTYPYRCNKCNDQDRTVHLIDPNYSDKTIPCPECKDPLCTTHKVHHRDCGCPVDQASTGLE